MVLVMQSENHGVPHLGTPRVKKILILSYFHIPPQADQGSQDFIKGPDPLALRWLRPSLTNIINLIWKMVLYFLICIISKEQNKEKPKQSYWENTHIWNRKVADIIIGFCLLWQ